MTKPTTDKFSTAAPREAHAHLAMHGQSLTMLHLGGTVSRDEALDRLRDHAAVLRRDDPAGRRWLLADAMRAEAWADPRPPSRDELDALCPDRPAAVLSFDYHAVVANTAAMRASGIDEDDPDPEGGVMQRDGAGRLTGLLLESAAWKVRLAVPPLTEAEREGAVLASLDHLAALGYTEVHDLLAPPWLGPTLTEIAAKGRLGLRVWLYPPLAELDEALAAAPSWEDGDRLVLAGGKVFADGTLNSRTAWMLRPFADPLPNHPCGTALMTAGDLEGAMRHAASRGVGLAVHAIGDAAVRATLDARARVGAGGTGWLACGRDRKANAGEAAAPGEGVPALRIEHAEIIDAADVPRFAALSTVCSVQPCHLLADIEALRRSLPHRLDRVLPLRDLVRSGCEPGRGLWFGSDVPIVRPDPADSLQAAIHRRRPGASAAEAIAPEQALTEAECRRAFGG